MISISAFKWVPDFARGQVRDLRPRWALEEAGLPYTTRLLASQRWAGFQFRSSCAKRSGCVFCVPFGAGGGRKAVSDHYERFQLSLLSAALRMNAGSRLWSVD